MQHILGDYTTPCIASAITTPAISGIQILNLSAALVSNYSASYSEALNFNGGDVIASNLDFCNVTITYTHPGQNDTINSETWLPMGNFNGRMLGVGGGGWVAGRFILSYVSMTAGISQGYAVTSTDAGIPTNLSATPASWGLSSPGHVNMNLLEDLGSVSLNETAYMAKALINDFYGHPPIYSYFSGCSQGGRQGMMLAQRYPEAYDGIAASAPAINWNEMATTGYWGQLLMQQSGHFPAPCEIQAITDSLIEQCDPVDGVIDGIVTDIEACDFDLSQMVGRSFFCSSNKRNMSISQETVDLVNSTWFGLTDNNDKPIWSGPHMTANLTGTITSPLNTVCSDTDYTCTGAPISLLTDWLKVFILKDKNANISHLSQEDLVSMYHSSVQQYDYVLGTRDANLSAFKARGGKLISYHGLSKADPIIPAYGSRNYYDRVSSLDSASPDFFRLFEVPGLGHCYNGPGAYPNGTFDALTAWVEHDVVPDTLTGYRPANDTGFRAERLLCSYPKKAVYTGSGCVDNAKNYSCV